MGKEMELREKAGLILSGFKPRMKDALYRAVWFERVCEDIRAHEHDMGLDRLLTREQMEYAAECYVYDGEYDCNLSYWENIENVVRLALEFCPDEGPRTRTVLTVSSIDWDYEGKDDGTECPDSLPGLVIIKDPDPAVLEGIDGEAEALTEYLTETYGCCVCGFVSEVEEVKEDD